MVVKGHVSVRAVALRVDTHSLCNLAVVLNVLPRMFVHEHHIQGELVAATGGCVVSLRSSP